MRTLQLALLMITSATSWGVSGGPVFRNPTTREAFEMLYLEEPQVIFTDPLQEKPPSMFLRLPFWNRDMEPPKPWNFA
jgi:hypothetical protein